MNESNNDAYIHAFDTAWDSFTRRYYKMRGIPPTKWEAFADGFSAGAEYARTHDREGNIIE